MDDSIIVKEFESGRLFNNVYVAHCARTGQGIIIDATGAAGRISAYIKEKKLTIKHIIYTHCHVDHICGAAKLAALTGAAAAAHSSAAKIMRGPATKAFSGFGMFFKPVYPSTYFEDGDFISVGLLQLRVLHTPGHSRDGICIVGHGIAFTGDTLFAGSVGRSDLPGGSASELTRNIREKLLTLDPSTIIYPGHGPHSTIAHELRTNPMLTGI